MPHLSASLYLDPGTGSLIIQLILGGLLAIGLGVRIFWRKIKSFFTHQRTITGNSPKDQSDEPD